MVLKRNNICEAEDTTGCEKMRRVERMLPKELYTKAKLETNQLTHTHKRDYITNNILEYQGYPRTLGTQNLKWINTDAILDQTIAIAYRRRGHDNGVR